MGRKVNGYPPLKKKINGKTYVYDRYTRRGIKGKKSLQDIGRTGVKTGAIRNYRVVQSPRKNDKRTWFLYIRY